MTLRIVGVGDPRTRRSAPLALAAVQAGFPSPAEDYTDRGLDLNELCIRNPSATYMMRVAGSSMEPELFDGDYLVVDRSREPRLGDVVVASVNGDFTVKRLARRGGKWVFAAGNAAHGDVEPMPEEEVAVWGVVTWSFRDFRAGESRR
jgi:DNA polymerase V